MSRENLRNVTRRPYEKLKKEVSVRITEIPIDLIDDCSRRFYFSAKDLKKSDPVPASEAIRREVNSRYIGLPLQILESGDPKYDGWETQRPGRKPDEELHEVRYTHGNTEIVGEIAGVVKHPARTKDKWAVIVEENASDSNFARWCKIGTERTNPTVAYRAAFNTYAFFGEPRRAVVAVVNRNKTDEMFIEVLHEGKVATLMERILSQVDNLVELLGNREAPPVSEKYPIGCSTCRNCEFRTLCGNGGYPVPAIDKEVEVTDEMVQQSLQRIEAADELKGQHKEEVTEASKAILVQYMAQRGLKTMVRNGILITHQQRKNTIVDFEALVENLTPEQHAEVVHIAVRDYVNLKPAE